MSYVLGIRTLKWCLRFAASRSVGTFSIEYHSSYTPAEFEWFEKLFILLSVLVIWDLETYVKLTFPYNISKMVRTFYQ